MLGAGYLGQSFAIRRRRAMFAGNLRNTYGGATRWDLLLRSDLNAERVVRVPRVLAHLRQRRQGLNADGVRVVQEALESRGVPAVAELAEHSRATALATRELAARHDRDSDPAQPLDAVEGAAWSRGDRLPVVRRPHHRQRRPVRGQRRVVRASTPPGSICTCNGGPRRRSTTRG